MNDKDLKIYASTLLGLLMAAYLWPWLALGGRARLLQAEPGWLVLRPLRHLRQDLQALPPEKPVCLYFGDSVMYSQEPSAPALPATRLPALVSAAYSRLPGAKPMLMAPFYSAGFKPNDYLLLSHALIPAGPVPKAVIFPVNMRFFSKDWYLDPTWQNPVLLRYYPLASFWHTHGYQATDPGLILTALAKLDEAAGGWNGDNARAISCFYAQRLRQLLQGDSAPAANPALALKRNYLQGLDPHHPMLKALLEAGDWCQWNGARPFFYFTPLPIEDIKQAWGPEEGALEQNIALIKKELMARGWQVEDYHGLIPHGFYAPGIEHLDLKSKEILAKHIAADLASALGSARD